MSLIPALGRQKQVLLYEFKGSLVCTVIPGQSDMQTETLSINRQTKMRWQLRKQNTQCYLHHLHTHAWASTHMYTTQTTYTCTSRTHVLRSMTCASYDMVHGPVQTSCFQSISQNISVFSAHWLVQPTFHSLGNKTFIEWINVQYHEVCIMRFLPCYT